MKKLEEMNLRELLKARKAYRFGTISAFLAAMPTGLLLGLGIATQNIPMIVGGAIGVAASVGAAPICSVKTAQSKDIFDERLSAEVKTEDLVYFDSEGYSDEEIVELLFNENE